MRLNRSTSLFGFTLWSLLATWMFFGCLELIEESQIIPAITEDTQEGEDYDEEALALASGLKSDLFHIGTLSSIQLLRVVIQPAVTLSTSQVYSATRAIWSPLSPALPAVVGLSHLIHLPSRP